MLTFKLKDDVAVQDACLGYKEFKLLFNVGPFPGGGDCLLIEHEGKVEQINSNDLIHDLEAYEISC